jgi:hypothetical protein
VLVYFDRWLQWYVWGVKLEAKPAVKFKIQKSCDFGFFSIARCEKKIICQISIFTF